MIVIEYRTSYGLVTLRSGFSYRRLFDKPLQISHGAVGDTYELPTFGAGLVEPFDLFEVAFSLGQINLRVFPLRHCRPSAADATLLTTES